MIKTAQKRLLLVGDDETIAVTSKQQLEQLGYTVMQVSTGEKAVETMRINPGIDLILMDMNPGRGIDGAEAAVKNLREHDIPFLFLSDQSTGELAGAAETDASFGYVPKTAGIAELDSSVRNAFRLFEARKRYQEAEKNNEIFRQIAENAEDVHWLVTADTAQMLYVSPAYERIWARSCLSLYENPQSFMDAVHHEDKQAVFDHYEQYRKSGTFDLEYRIVRPRGDIRWIRAKTAPVKNDAGTVIRHAGTATDVTERKCMESTQTFLLSCGSPGAGGEFFKMLAYFLATNLGMDYVCIDRLVGDGLNAQTEAIYNDGKYETNVTYALKDTPCGDVVGKTICCFPRDIRKLFPKDAALQDLRSESYMGTTLWSHEGKPIGLIALIARRAMDNPALVETILKMVAVRAAGELERKQGEEEIKKQLAEKETILKEVHHRIKNNMNTISCLLSLQANSANDPSAVAVLEDAGSRIRSMSLLYDKLYQSHAYTELSIKDYLVTLADEVVANFPNADRVRIETDLQDFKLDARHLQTVGIIINELLTNVMKYAFAGKKQGQITVSARNDAGRVTITVRDDGIGIPESVSFENAEGFGLQLVHALAQQLDGSIRLERDSGTKAILEFTA